MHIHLENDDGKDIFVFVPWRGPLTTLDVVGVLWVNVKHRVGVWAFSLPFSFVDDCLKAAS